jgi:hypothetical protein
MLKNSAIFAPVGTFYNIFSAETIFPVKKVDGKKHFV